MNIADAIRLRIPRICKPKWCIGNSNEYIRLPLLAEGVEGPWAEHYSNLPYPDLTDIKPGSQKLLCILPEVLNDEGYEPYEGPISSYEAENFAKDYVEI